MPTGPESMASPNTPVEGSKFSRFVAAALGGGIPGAIAMVSRGCRAAAVGAKWSR